MRLLIITANAALESTQWWEILGGTPGITAALILTEQRPRSAWRSIRGNLRRHGPLWIPYRLGHFVNDRVLRRGSSSHPLRSVAPAFPVERLTVASFRDPATLGAVRDWRPDMGFSIGAPILKPELFSIPSRGTINLHLGKTPEFRGAPPGFWELWTGAREVGATIHFIDEGLDTGPIIAQATAPIYPADRWADVVDRAEELGARLLERVLRAVVAGEPATTRQDGAGRTYRMPTVSQRMQLAGRLLARRAKHLSVSRTAAKSAAALLLLGVVRPLRDLRRRVTASHPVRVLTYHRVTSLCRDGMTVPPAVFAAQLAYIRRFHDVVSLDRALDALERGERLRRPMAVVTFDDAYRSVHEQAWPRMRETDTPGCIFISTALAGTDARFEHDRGQPMAEFFPVMSWEELAECRSGGWSMGAHTASHVRLSAQAPERAHGEMRVSLEEVRMRFALPDVVMAYPFGSRDDMTPDQVAEARRMGYRAVCSNFGGENLRGEPTPTVHRLDVGGDHGTLSWKCYVQGLGLVALGRRFAGARP